MLRNIVLILLLTASTFAVAAEDETPKYGLALKLAQLIDYSSQWKRYEVRCKQTEHPELDPYRMYRSMPDFFGGISPSSKYWPRVQNIYHNFQLSMCDAIQLPTIDQLVANELAKDMTEDDLLASIHFYSSPEGQHLGVANVRATEIMGEYLQKAADKYSVEINNTAKMTLEALIQEFQKNEK